MPTMKPIYTSLRRYFRESIDWRYLLILTLLLGSLTAFFYADKSRLQWIGGGANDGMRLLWNFCIFGGTLFGALLLYIPFAKEKQWIRSSKFWLAVFTGAAAFSFATFFYWHKEWIKTITDGPVEIFLLRISRYPANSILLILPAFLWWWLNDRQHEPFYGIKKTSLKPYITLLFLMVPLIITATFSADFLKQYPQAIRMLNAAKIEQGRMAYAFVFEGFYGLNFVVTEFFFRGFLLFVLSRWIGYGAVLPVAAFYVTIHFGKPLGETISSFFGGIILGVIALETRSVWGGVLIHLGIAWGMELAAAIAR